MKEQTANAIDAFARTISSSLISLAIESNAPKKLIAEINQAQEDLTDALANENLT